MNTTLQPFPGNDYLKLVPGSEKIVIPACKGGYVITNDNETFAYIDLEFEDYEGVNEPSKPTPATKVAVYDLNKKGTTKEIFDSITKDTKVMELTLEQLKMFCIEHKDLLSKNGCSWIICKNSKGGFFVANVFFDGHGRLEVYILRLAHDYEWHADRVHRVVLPYLDVSL